MIKIENRCVDCGLPCLGNSCPYLNVEVMYCDVCGSEGADYILDGDDYCEYCAKKYIDGLFSDLSITEQADLLNISLIRTEKDGIF